MKIKFEKVSDIYDFIRISNRYDSYIDVKQRQQVIDGHSNLGMFSLDLNEPMDVEMITEDERISGRFYNEIRMFKIK